MPPLTVRLRGKRWFQAACGATAAAAVGAAVLFIVHEPSPLGAVGSWRLTFDEEFGGARLDPRHWIDHEPWQQQGYRTNDAWFPVPHGTRQLEVAQGRAILKARHAGGLPEDASMTSVELSTRGRFSIAAGSTSFTEAKIDAPTAKGLLPAFWLLGDGTNDTGQGWPINGEIDILEFSNNVDEQGRPYASVWYPKDVYTKPPGTFLNGIHDTHPASFRPEPQLRNSWHTWGLYRSPERMTIYVDGVQRFTFRPGTAYRQGIPLPRMLFTKPMHVRLSLGVGGDWAGAGRPKSDVQDGDLQVDYVRSWRSAA